MQNFVFYNPAKIVFGKGCEKETGKYVKMYGGTKVLIHYGGGSVKKNGAYDAAVASLKAEGIDYIELGGVQPNPRLSLIKKGIQMCKDNGVDFVLAIGGGSVIDSSKSIACGALYKGENIWDCYTAKDKFKEVLPIGVVLTIPAAGSESSDNCVVTNDETGEKRSSATDLMIPKFAIMNPEYTFSLPPYQTACGITDIMMHTMERYFTQEANVDLTDHLCEGLLKTMLNNGPKVLKNPNDYNARAEIMWAGSLSHNGLMGTGRIGDWGTHRMQHELGARYDITHGAGLAIVMPAWMKYVYKLNIPRFAQFAVKVMGVDYSFDNLEAVALEGIERLRNFFRSIGMPTSFKEAGLPCDHLEEMAEQALRYDSIGKFKVLTKEDIVNIYRLAAE